MNRSIHSLFDRLVAAVVVLALPMLGCATHPPLLPTAGIPQFEEVRLVRVPGGLVNTAGGNLFLRRVDLSLDTVLGTHELAAVYNSTSGEWLWNFQIHYNGDSFLDPTGHLWEGASVPPDGGAFPGSVWRRVDSDTVMTKGGRAYHFDTEGRLAYIAWATLDYPRLAFSDTGVDQCVAPGVCAALFTFSLDAAGDPLLLTDARTGRVASFEYDGFGRLVTARDAAANESGAAGFRYEYSFAGTLLTALVNSEGERVEYQYQGERRILFVTQIGEGDPRHRFDFHGTTSENWPTLHTNPLGGVTRYHYQAGRRLSHIILEPTGETTRFLYAGHVRPSEVESPSGAVVSFVYDDDDATAVVEASGRGVSIEYQPAALNPDDPLGTPIRRVSDDLGLLVERDYDSQGRPVRVTNGDAEAVVTTWSGALPGSVIGPGGAELSFPSYGTHGHWLEVAGANAGSRHFDAVGNLVASSLMAKQGGVLSTDWDAGRRLAAIHVAATSADSISATDVVSLAHRADGRATRIERPHGGDHEFDYDALGRPVATRELVDGAWRTTNFEYDAAGNHTAVELANGMRREFEFDVYGRLVALRAFRNGTLEGEVIFQLANGLPVAKTDTSRGTTTTYVYDAAERLVLTTYGHGETLASAYDLRSNLSDLRFALPGAGEIAHLQFEYDPAGRPRSIADGATGDSLIHYVYAGGRLVEKHFANGLSRSFFDDADGTPTGSETRDTFSGEVVATSTLTVTAETAPPRQQVANAVATALAETTENYWLRLGASLSVPDQLAGQRVFHWNDGADAFDDFDYDELGNRVGDASGNAFAYNGERNRLTSASLALTSEGLDYSYDEAGYVTNRNGSFVEWNAMGRIASHGPDSFAWDMLGNPISRTVGGVTRRFDLFDGAVESDAAAGLVSQLEIQGELVFDFGGDHRYLHRDFRNNVSFVSDAAGSIVAHHHYRPYGEHATYGAAGEDAVFAGRPEAGALVLMGARVYDPLAGRFLSPDPILHFINQYTWTLGNPLLFGDPSGLHPETHLSAKATAVAGALAVLAVTLSAIASAPTLLAGLGLSSLAAMAAGILGIEIGAATIGGITASLTAGTFVIAYGAAWVAATSLLIETFNPPELPPTGCACPGPPTNPGEPRDDGGDRTGGKNMIQKISIGGGEGSWKPASFGGASGAFGGSPACGLIGIEAVLLLGLLRRRRRRRAPSAAALLIPYRRRT